MKLNIASIWKIGLITLIFSSFQQLIAQTADFEKYQEEVNQIVQAALDNDEAWERLTYFVDYFPGRLSGSEILEKSIDWSLELLKNDGFNNVYGQKVTVPKWVRGDEYVKMHLPYKKDLPMLGLGNSVGTYDGPIRAEAVVVRNFDELEQMSDQVEGKIIVYNMPWIDYGQTVQYKRRGAIEASKHGAVASLIRSVTPYSMQTPHTGPSRHEDGVKKIPHAALTVEETKFLQRMQDRGETLELEIYMEARDHPDTESRNVIAEIPGSEYPEEIVTVGGHIDSWDVGHGAMDDAGGFFAGWEAARIIKELGLNPKRTIRIVGWTSEETGLQGANAYRDKAMEEGIENHVFGFESDIGVFDPISINFAGTDEAQVILQEIANLLLPTIEIEVESGWGAPDLTPLRNEGVPVAGLRVNDQGRYFWYHHSPADTIDKLDKDEFNRCVATMAAMIYVVAQIEDKLPR